MSDTQKLEFFIRVSEVLYYIWDPVGVNEILNARDEYDSYVPQIVDSITSSRNEGSIFETINKIQIEMMELHPTLEHNRKVSELLLGWYNLITDLKK